MKQGLLTDDAWVELVKRYIVPAYLPQEMLADKFEEHANWVGRRLVEAKWTLPETEWTVKEAVKHYRKLDNLLAMLFQAHDGRTNRDGEQVSGWAVSPERRKLAEKSSLEAERLECRTMVVDCGRYDDCGKFPRCQDCDKRPQFRAGRGRHGKDDAGLDRAEFKIPGGGKQ